MLAVLCASPRPPLGVAILGLIIVIVSRMLHMLPYIMFCSMIALSVWPHSHPLPPNVNGRPNQEVRAVYSRVGSQPPKEARSFELNAELRILIFLLAIPVTSVIENAFFRPARSIFLRTIECWFDMRYVHPAQITGSWPDTWTPIFNALRSCQFLADFIDGAMGRNSGLAHTAEAHTSDTFGGFHSTAQPSEQRAPSFPRCKHVPSPDSSVHSHLECSTNAPRPRKIFVSPPHVSPQSPWKANDLGGFSPVSKNLSRIVGILFHHPPLRKPVIRRQINLIDKVTVPPHILDRLWSTNKENVAPAWACMSSLGTAICNSLIPHDGAQMLCSAWGHVSNNLVAAAPELDESIAGGSFTLSMSSRFLPGTCEAIEQPQFEQQQCWGYAYSSPPLPEPPARTLPHDFVSDWPEGQYIQPWSMQTPVHLGFPFQDQHIITPPVYREQELAHQPFHGFPSGLDPMVLVQHDSHVYSGVPERSVADQEACALPVIGECESMAPVLESPLSPFSSLSVAPQEQFTFQMFDQVPLFNFSEDPPRLDHSASTGRPETARTSDGYATQAVFVPCTTSQDSPFQPVSPDAPPETPWSDYHHQSPAIPSPVLQRRHIEQPFWGLEVTGTFTFDVSQATPYFDFSHHVPPPPDGVDVIPRTSNDANDAWPPSSASCEDRLPFDQGVQSQWALDDSASQPQEAALSPQPFALAEQAGSGTVDAEPSATGGEMTVDGDDSSSDSDSDDSDTDTDMDFDSDSSSSSSDDDSDSDSDSDSSEEEDDVVVVAEAACKTDASSKAQDDVQGGVPANKNTATAAAAMDEAADSGSSDSDSDGYYEHISTPTPPGAPNDAADSSSSDEDMSDHEEEDRLYWERFYTPRHRRQQPGLSG